MTPIDQFPITERKKIRYVLTDIDDTLTTKGRLPAVAYTALEDLKNAGIRVVPITGRPAGWCDHIARMWPVDAVVGENGAFYFHYREDCHQMMRRFWKSEEQRREDKILLEKIRSRVLSQVPGSAISADQPYREADLAVDFCEDVHPLDRQSIDRIVEIFTEMGAMAKVSSIHVNGWFGNYDKLSMTRILFEEIFDRNLDDIREQVIFSGDSPNDAPMFAFFPNSVGVANVADFKDRLEASPAWITHSPGGQGFAEMTTCLMEAQKG